MYKYVVFDIDGTILDTEHVAINALKKVVLEETEKDIDINDLIFAFGIPGDVTLKTLNVPDINTGLNKWNSYIEENSGQVVIFKGISDVLEQLKKKGIILGLVTSKSREEFDRLFVPYGINEFFKYSVCAGETAKGKPHGDPIVKFLELSKANKTEVLYIGDTKYDRDCAHDAGVKFGLAKWGCRSVFKNVDYIFEKPDDIMDLV